MVPYAMLRNLDSNLRTVGEREDYLKGFNGKLAWLAGHFRKLTPLDTVWRMDLVWGRWG